MSKPLANLDYLITKTDHPPAREIQQTPMPSGAIKHLVGGTLDGGGSDWSVCLRPS